LLQIVDFSRCHRVLAAQGLRNAYRRLLDLDFDRLLLAHGDPIVHGAKDELFAFVERP